ncbi:hypothetical protein JCM10207_004994 [Rhodosporidiobolus poonsookiae]
MVHSQVGATAKLAFGTKVQVLSLYGAAKAFKHIEGALRALPLLRLRKKSGTLRLVGGSDGAVARLPVEVWDMILGAVRAVGAELADKAMDNLEDGVKVSMDDGSNSDSDEDLNDWDEPVQKLFKCDVSSFLGFYNLQAEWPRDLGRRDLEELACTDQDLDSFETDPGYSLTTWTLVQPCFNISAGAGVGPDFPILDDSATGGYESHQTTYATFTFDDVDKCRSPQVLGDFRHFFQDWTHDFPEDQLDWKPRFVFSLNVTAYG